MILAATALAILVVMALALLRGVLGPTIHDRVLGVNMVGTKTVLLISVLALMWGRSDVLDIALAYGLINFIGVIAMLRFYRGEA
jgi:multicomponent Na+:H+ antiporter subunit F